MLVICLGKSTYARCGIIVNVTPLEPEWEGHVTLEFSNTTPLPAKIYANEGACQFIFLKGDKPCDVSYRDRSGKYQSQTASPSPVCKRASWTRSELSAVLRSRAASSSAAAKNAALALMPACLLTGETLNLANLPHLADIYHHGPSLGPARRRDGAECEAQNGGHTGRVLELNAGNITNTTAPYDLVRKIARLGAGAGAPAGPLRRGQGLAARRLRHRHPPPSICILKALEQMGAQIEVEGGYIIASVPGKRLKGAHIVFPQVTVGGTENILMAAALAEGDTIIANAAREPEVCDPRPLPGGEWGPRSRVSARAPSRSRVSIGCMAPIIRYCPTVIETGTYAVAAAITRGHGRADRRPARSDGIGRESADRVRRQGLRHRSRA